MDLIADLERASDVDNEVLGKIISIYCEKEASTVDRAVEFNHLISQPDSDSVKAVLRLISFLRDAVVESRDYQKSIDEIQETVNKISKSNSKACIGWNKIYESLDDLKPYFVVKKIESIKNRYSRVRDFQITTELRPVFNMDRTELETKLYPSIIKISTVDDKDFICEVYQEDIDDLIKELENAKDKIKVLRKAYEG